MKQRDLLTAQQLENRFKMLGTSFDAALPSARQVIAKVKQMKLPRPLTLPDPPKRRLHRLRKFLGLGSVLLMVVLLTGCATGGNKKMAAADLDRIKVGETTRAELVTWFGKPRGIGLLDNGESTATWIHVFAQSAVFVTTVKQQMLVVRFGPDDVVRQVQLSDDFDDPPAQ